MINNNIALDILLKGKELGVHFFIEGEELKVKLSQGKTIDSEFLSKIKENKKSIFFFLEEQEREKRRAKRPKIIRQNYSEIDKVPLSFAQERLWFIDKLDRGSAHYNMPGVVEVEGELDLYLLKQVIRKIINRHSIIRTVIKEENGVPYQEVLPENQWEFNNSIEISQMGKTEVDQIIEEELAKTYNLAKDHKVRMTLLLIEGKVKYIIFSMHHIASDGVSTDIFFKELFQLYMYELDGSSIDVLPLSVQYSDYSIWQRKFLSGNALETQMAYWTNKLSDVIPLELPLDYTRPENQSNNGANYESTIGIDRLEKLKKLSHQNGTTVFMTLLSVFKVLMYRYSGQTDFCVGTPIANREQHEIQNLIGFFINTLAIRSNLEGNPTFLEFLSQIRKTTLEAYEYQQVPFEKIVAEVVGSRDMSRSPIFQVLFTGHIIPSGESDSEMKLGDTTLKSVPFNVNISQYDINFDVIESDKGIDIRILYCTDLFEKTTIERLITHFKTLVDSVLSNQEVRIDDLVILPEAERRILLNQFNGNSNELNQNETILDHFHHHVVNDPNAISVEFENSKLTYLELDIQSNQIANYLALKQVPRKSLIPICLDRGPKMIASILGVLKHGSAYVPIDPEYPDERVTYMINHTDSTIFISSNKYSDAFHDKIECDFINIDENSVVWEANTASIPSEINLSDLAYMIFTSGSTGMPKGAMIEHGGMLNHILGLADELEMDSSTAMAQNASISFDISVWQMLGPLCIGGISKVYSKDLILNPSRFIQKISEDGITVLELVPSYLSLLLEEYIPELVKSPAFLSKLEYLIVTGEALKKSLLETWFNYFPDKPIVNAYGPTEASDDVTLHVIRETPKKLLVPIGKPIQNVRMYVVDKNEELCPIGIEGELCVGGMSVGRGYYKDKAKTDTVFIEDKFFNGPHNRFYKTGDMGRWLSNGNLEFLGRQDFQVKIRGHRIELQEIEYAFNSLENIKEAVIIDFEDKNEVKMLCAFVTYRDSLKPIKDYQKKMEDKLPEFMIPSVVIPLDEFPLTLNGKIDRKKLPIPNFSELLNDQFVEASSEVEIGLVKIWKELLNLDKIGIHDDFFEIGGHSLIATRVATTIQKIFDVEIPIRMFFRLSTIEELAKYIHVTKESQEETSIEEYQILDIN